MLQQTKINQKAREVSQGSGLVRPTPKCRVSVVKFEAWRSEAKQTQTREFGTEKYLLQNQERSTGFWLGLKTPNSPVVFGEEFLQANV